METIDEFLTVLIEDGFIPQNYLRSCNISASIIRTGDLQIVLESILNSGRICRMFVEEIAERINTPPIGETSVTIANPQVHNLMYVCQPQPCLNL